MFKKTATGIPGCVLLRPKPFRDFRGFLVKLFHADSFDALGLRADFKEEYYSVSRKGVLRGLHLQLPPHEHVKCVACLRGAIFDVVVDLRKSSPTFKEHFSVRLTDKDTNILYVPAGVAHGFYTLTESALVLNRATSVFDADSGSGIRWDSCNIAWPDPNPILSTTDKRLVPLSEFRSPFC